MDLGIKGKKALVMGGSSGIGRGIAEVLVQEGVQVAIAARTQKTLDETKSAIGASLALSADFKKPTAARDLVNGLCDKWNGLDILVINTGGPEKGGVEDVTTEKWQEGFQTLWMGAIDPIKAVLPSMKKQKWGRIMVITSLSSREPMKGLIVSNGIRAGLSGLIKSISNEIAPFGITINCILPGYTDTDRLRELNIPKEAMTAQIPAGRLGTTKELGALATFLSSDLAGYITGQSLMIDGGVTKSF